MGRFASFTYLILLIVIACNVVPAFAEEDQRMKRLHAGEVILEASSLGKDTQQATVLIHATPEKLLRALTDYDLFFRIFPDNAGAQVKQKGEGWDEICFQMSRVIRFEYCLHRVLDVENQKVSWTLLEGNFKEMKGYWRFTPTSDGQATVASFSLLVEVSWLPDRLTQMGNRKGMVSTVKELRDWAENGVFAGDLSHK